MSIYFLYLGDILPVWTWGVEVHCNHIDTNSVNGLTLSEETRSALYAEKVALHQPSAALSSIWLLKLYYLVKNNR